MEIAQQLDAFERKVRTKELDPVAAIGSRAVSALQEHALQSGFIQLMPVMLSPFTDPLNHSVYPAELEYEGRRLKLTASMIFHKQLALSLLSAPKIFIVSPNIRLEKASVKSSSNHLLEFSQFDMEMRDASMNDAIAFVDSLVRSAITAVRRDCAAQLRTLERTLPPCEQPFPIYSSEELRAEYGEDFERRISERSNVPVFVTDFKREFYDRETPGRRGHYNNFDLIYSEGFGEALSGAEREFEYDQIVYRMQELNMDLAPYQRYLEAARRGLLPRSAGAGLGVQRFVKFLCGRRDIADVCPFDRSIATDFTF